MGKKKKRTVQVTEKPTGATGGVSGQWILNMANKMEPEGTLKNDGLVSDPIMTGKILNKPGGRLHKFCCDTGCSTNVMPARLAALNGLDWYPVDKDEPSYRSVTNQKLDVVGQTTCFIKLQKVKNPVKLSFIVVLDDGNESLLCLDTLKDLSIVPKDFPNPMNNSMRDNRIMRVTEEEEGENVLTFNSTVFKIFFVCV